MTWNSRTGNCPTTYAENDPEEKFRISYHPGGYVRFHEIGGAPRAIHCEPIHAITKKQLLALISIPEIDSLTVAAQTEVQDLIFDWPDGLMGRATFWIELGPPRLENPFPPSNKPLAAVTYDPWFAIYISLGAFPAPILESVPEKGVIKFVPDQDFVTTRVSKEQGVIDFHQAKAGVKFQFVTAFKPGTGEYRIVFAVPMRVPPQLTVDFFDPSLRAVITLCTTYEVRFKVKGPRGHAKEWVPIRGFTLDADFY
jgi:hypothetical protein